MKAARRAANTEAQALAEVVGRHTATKGTPTSMGDVLAEPRMDPWGRAYVLETASGVLVVRSFGPDGRRNTADDIVQHAAAP